MRLQALSSWHQNWKHLQKERQLWQKVCTERVLVPLPAVQRSSFSNLGDNHNRQDTSIALSSRLWKPNTYGWSLVAEQDIHFIDSWLLEIHSQLPRNLLSGALCVAKFRLWCHCAMRVCAANRQVGPSTNINAHREGRIAVHVLCPRRLIAFHNTSP